MPSLAQPVELLQALSAAFAELRVGWYVFGAQAVLCWGRPRFTEDIDVTVLAGAVETAQLVAALERHGFSMRVEGTDAFIAQTRVVPLEFTNTGWPVDLVLGGPGLEEEFLRRAKPVVILPGVSIPVISPEDLIVTKILAGRPKDLEDVRGVVVERARTLDAAAVRRTLSMLEDALGVSDLLPAFERFVKS